MTKVSQSESANPALDQEAAMALLRGAEADQEAGNFAAAKAACETLIAAGSLVEWAQFFLGRMYRNEGNGEAAMAAFSHAIDAEPSMFWAHCERLILAQELGEPANRQGEFIDAMVMIPWEKLQGGMLRAVELIGHANWDNGNVADAHRIFERLWPSPELNELTLVRIVEADLDADLVGDVVKQLEEMPELDETALRILVQHNERRGDAEAMSRLLATRSLPDALTVKAWAAMARAYAVKRKDRIASGITDQSPQEAELIARVHDFAKSIEAGDEAFPDARVPQIDLIANVLWDAGDSDLAYRLFTRMWPSTDIGVITLVRIVEADRDAAMMTEAIERLDALPGLDETALRIVADHHARQGDVGREIAMLERRRKSAPKDFQAWVALARSYAKKGDRANATSTLDQGHDFPVRQRTFANLIVHLELGDANAGLIDFRTLARLWGEVPKYPGIRLAYLFSDAYDVARRDEVLGILSVHYPDDGDVALVQVNAAMRDQRWVDARAMFDANFADIASQPQNVRLANIDILAFSGELETAYALLEQERVSGTLPANFLRSTLRILGELERWDDLFSLGLEHLSEDASFDHFLSIMIRAGRKTARSVELFDALLALPRPLKRAQQDALFAVMEDLAEAGHHDILSRAGDLDVPYERDHRIQLKLRAASPPEDVTKDLCVYYCADLNYLMPALVSLTALAMSNVSITRRAVFYLIVDSDTVALATEAGGALARRLGLTLEVVDAATIVLSADRLRTSYGLFTGGQQLALAAYYRIFFARHLVEQGKFVQALYVDADTIVRPGLEELFAIAHETPIMARYETDRPEVRHATEIHQLKGRYFNSGVLHFNLAHPELPALLDRAIAAAIDPDVTLIFQDQCALNIAFDLNMSELPPRFNYFNPPSVSGDGIAATDAVIVHFLDRPKPWDSLYRRRAREWFEWFDLVETLRQGYPADAV